MPEIKKLLGKESLLAIKDYIDTEDSGKEDKENKTTILSDASTDIQYPSAKAVVDYVDENDQILSNNICAPYDNTATYEVNDIVIYNNQLVRCTVAITEPEEFNPEHWAASTIKYNFVTKNGDQRITGDKVFDGNVTFNGGLAYTGTGSIIMNPSYLGLNNSEIQTSNTSVEIGTGTNKTYKNRLPSTFYSTVGLKGNTTVDADLKFGSQMTINKDGNLYFVNGTAWSVNINDTHKLRYTKSDGQLELRNGDLKLSDGFKIKWGGGSAYIQGSSTNQHISFGINNLDKLIFYGGYSQFNSDLRLNYMGTNNKSVATKEYVDNGLGTKSSATNLENGIGTNAVQEKMADVTVNFVGRNPNAEALDPTLSTTINTGANGNQSVALNKNTMALGISSMTNGNKTIAKGEESHAEGYQSVTLGDGSHAEGAQTVAFGLQSHSEGGLTQAIGDNSHAEGYSTIAGSYTNETKTGTASHAEGVGTKIGSHIKEANQGADQSSSGSGGSGSGTPPEPGTFVAGEGSHAEGYNNLVVGFGSHAEGLRNYLTGNYAHIEGVNNTNSGNYSHIEGFNNINSGDVSLIAGTWNNNSGYNTFIAGHHNINTYDNKVVFGEYNNNKSGTLLEVGNGTDSTHRSNAFEVYRDGHIEAGAETTSSDSSKTLATKGYVDSTKQDTLPTKTGHERELLRVNSSGNFEYTKNLPILTTAPTADNTDGLIICVLSSEPATKYEGYLYIITGGNN